MEKRIELEKRGRNPDQIKELNLDNSRSQVIAGLDESFVNLETLSMINVGLTSLKGFPKLRSLKRLELSDNRLSNGLENLGGCPCLENLNLCGNRIKDFDVLKPLSVLNKLKHLDLFNCDVTDMEDYREKMFELIPSLVYLDGFDKNNKEMENEDSDEDDENGVVDDEEDGSDEESEIVDDGGDVGDEEDDDEDDEEDEEEEGSVGNQDLDEDAEPAVDDEEDDDDEEEEEELEPGLSYLADSIDEEDDVNNEFVPDEEEEEDCDFDEDDEAGEEQFALSGKQGLKRKSPDEEGETEN